MPGLGPVRPGRRTWVGGRQRVDEIAQRGPPGGVTEQLSGLPERIGEPGAAQAAGPVEEADGDREVMQLGAEVGGCHDITWFAPTERRVRGSPECTITAPWPAAIPAVSLPVLLAL